MTLWPSSFVLCGGRISVEVINFVYSKKYKYAVLNLRFSAKIQSGESINLLEISFGTIIAHFAAQALSRRRDMHRSYCAGGTFV